MNGDRTGKDASLAPQHCRPLVVGLTGSIGMGKSTTAGMFTEAGVPVWDADAAVHRLYAPDGAGTRAIADLFPEAVSDAGVDRAKLRELVLGDPEAMARLEEAIHPLVAADREAFIAEAGRAGHDIVLVDVPLLFETGAEKGVDAVVVVSAPAELQRERVLARGTMSAEEFERILARQMPDEEKRRRADYVIDTTSFESARKGVDHVLDSLRKRLIEIT